MEQLLFVACILKCFLIKIFSKSYIIVLLLFIYSNKKIYSARFSLISIPLLIHCFATSYKNHMKREKNFCLLPYPLFQYSVLHVPQLYLLSDGAECYCYIRHEPINAVYFLINTIAFIKIKNVN